MKNNTMKKIGILVGSTAAIGATTIPNAALVAAEEAQSYSARIQPVDINGKILGEAKNLTSATNTIELPEIQVGNITYVPKVHKAIQTEGKVSETKNVTYVPKGIAVSYVGPDGQLSGTEMIEDADMTQEYLQKAKENARKFDGVEISRVESRQGAEVGSSVNANKELVLTYKKSEATPTTEAENKNGEYRYQPVGVDGNKLGDSVLIHAAGNEVGKNVHVDYQPITVNGVEYVPRATSADLTLGTRSETFNVTYVQNRFKVRYVDAKTRQEIGTSNEKFTPAFNVTGEALSQYGQNKHVPDYTFAGAYTEDAADSDDFTKVLTVEYNQVAEDSLVDPNLQVRLSETPSFTWDFNKSGEENEKNLTDFKNRVLSAIHVYDADGNEVKDAQITTAGLRNGKYDKAGQVSVKVTATKNGKKTEQMFVFNVSTVELTDANKTNIKPINPVPVLNPNALRDFEKEDVVQAMRLTQSLKEGTEITVDDQGNVTFKFPDGSSKTVNGTDVVVQRDNVAPTLKVKESNITLEEGKAVNPLDNVEVTDDQNQKPDVKVTDNGGMDFNNPTPGTYLVVVEATDRYGEKVQATMTYTITPKINIPQFSVAQKDVTITEGTDIDLREGVTASDKEDGDLTSKINIVSNGGLDVNKPGQYVVRYEVEDSEGHTNSMERVITVVAKTTPAPNPNPNPTPTPTPDPTPQPQPKPNEKPKLDIKYKEFNTVVGTALNVRGNITTAYDMEDGAGLSKVVINAEGARETESGYIWSAPGTYTVTYSLTDSNGETTTVSMKVTVKDKPVITATQNVTVFKGSTVQDLIASANALAFDGVGNPLPPKLEGVYDLNTPGTYNVEFVATSADGVDARVPVTITVIEAPAKGVVILANDTYSTTVGNPLDILSSVQVSKDGRVLSNAEVARVTRITGNVDWNTPGVYTQRIEVTIDGKTYSKDIGVEVLSFQQAKERSNSIAGSNNIETQAVDQGEKVGAGKGLTDTAALAHVNSNAPWYASLPLVGGAVGVIAAMKRKKLKAK